MFAGSGYRCSWDWHLWIPTEARSGCTRQTDSTNDKGRGSWWSADRASKQEDFTLGTAQAVCANCKAPLLQHCMSTILLQCLCSAYAYSADASVETMRSKQKKNKCLPRYGSCWAFHYWVSMSTLAYSVGHTVKQLKGKWTWSLLPVFVTTRSCTGGKTLASLLETFAVCMSPWHGLVCR